MFKKQLQADLKEIFGFSEVTFNEINYAGAEQDIIFVEIDDVKARLANTPQGRQIARVSGQLVYFVQDNKMPFGLIQKRIEKAPLATMKRWFFSNIDRVIPDAPIETVNLNERRTNFLFLYDAQYDPDRGLMDEEQFDTNIAFNE